MKIVLLESFFGGSHEQWAKALQANSKHEITILSLPDKHWKWRMHGGAISLARKFLEQNIEADLILASDMLDLNIFLSLTRAKTSATKTAIYFHENQLTYPWSPTDEDTRLKRDMHYAFINVSSALSADKLFFNSEYHLNSFINEVPNFLKVFPDYQENWIEDNLKSKSEVLYLNLDLSALINAKPEYSEVHKRAVVLWNHRWEYDKNPEAFFNVLYKLQDRGVEFKLIVLGEARKSSPDIFSEAKIRLADNILHWGFVKSRQEYAELLWQADILPVCSNQDFFGASVVEAMACNVFPLLPNRLAYPEHLPAAYKETFLYNNFEDLVNRLQRLIFDVSVLRKQNIQKWVMKYNWKEGIINYDLAFDKILD